MQVARDRHKFQISMYCVILLLLTSIDLTFSVNSQFRKYVVCRYDVWIRKHNKNSKELEILQTIKSQGLLNIKYESPESPEQESSSSDSGDSACSYRPEEEIQSLYTPETLQIETPTNQALKKSDWTLQTISTAHSPRPQSLEKLARKITKKDSIFLNNSDSPTEQSLRQRRNVQRKSYLGESAMSYDYRYSDLSNVPSPKKISVQEQKIKQLEEENKELVENMDRLLDLKIRTNKYQQELLRNITKQQKEIENKENYIVDMQNYVCQMEQRLKFISNETNNINDNLLFGLEDFMIKKGEELVVKLSKTEQQRNHTELFLSSYIPAIIEYCNMGSWMR